MNNYQEERYQNPIKKYNQSKLTENFNTTKALNNSVLKKDTNNESYLFNKKILSSNESFMSLNQKLSGPPNPKTLLKPIITPPITDIDYWNANNLINHSHINTQSKWDTYLSGYDVTDCDNEFSFPTKNNSIPVITENFEYPYFKEKQDDKHNKNQTGFCDNNFGLINTTSGYNPNQVIESNLPSNLASSMCERDEKMKEYNKNLFTQNIQPDIYTKSEIIEPINSNIGISFTQQFGPKTYSKDHKGITVIQRDPNIFLPYTEPHQLNNVTEADVYDPRFYGYGTSYRSYIDKKIGQPRFYYDDVNSIRMPNYLVRSNIDFTKYADSYGPLRDNNKHGNQYNSNIRDLANDTFLQSSLQHRTELQERLMSKRNNELWQLRKYPKHNMAKK